MDPLKQKREPKGGSMSDLVLVSAFGRGHWLAAEMAEKGFSVYLLDVTETMGRWTPEDWEGPFGLFMSENLTDLQKERLTEDDYLDSVDHGFTLWLKDGPLDMRGPIFPYRFQKKGYPWDVKNYLQNLKPSQKENIQTIRDMGFSKNWLAHFAHQLSANVFKDSSQGMDYSHPLPLLSSYYIRRVSRRGYQKGCDWVRSKGVRITSARIKDLFFERGICQGLEVSGEVSGEEENFIQGSHFIWCLSSEESHIFTPHICEKLFPKGPTLAQWYWVRYRIQLEPQEWLHALPIKFTMIDDIELPWTHTNLCMVQKTSKEFNYDTWVRLPRLHCLQKDSLEDISQEIMELFQRRIPYCQPQLLDMPQDYSYDRNSLGPGLFPVYKEEALKKLKHRFLRNFYFDGPEMWNSLEWGGQLRNQSHILHKIQQFYDKQRLKTP